MALSEEPGITISGPARHRAQARKILTSNGFSEADEENPTGLPDTTEGKADASVAFLTVHGEDLDRVVELLHGTGWEIRGHWVGIIKTSPLLQEISDDRMDDFERRLAELAAKVGGR